MYKHSYPKFKTLKLTAVHFRCTALINIFKIDLFRLVISDLFKYIFMYIFQHNLYSIFFLFTETWGYARIRDYGLHLNKTSFMYEKFPTE